MTRGIRTDGIRTVDDLKARCWVDETTGCWLWRGATSKGFPAMWLPAIRQRCSSGVAIGVLLNGAKPPAGLYWYRTCAGGDCCLSPKHRLLGTKSQQMLAAGMTRDPVQRARVALGKRKVSKFSEQAVAEIVASSEPLRVDAERYGMSITHVSRIKRGKARAQLSAQGASVFSWRPA